MSIWKQVTAIEDGQNVEASVINRPLSELAERTSYLKDLLHDSGLSDYRSSIRFTAQLEDASSVWPGAIVCIDPETKKYVLAEASMSLFDPFVASSSCFAIGMVCSVDMSAGTGIVAALGLVDLSSGFDLASMVETGETFRNGMYYLSPTEKGRITSVPSAERVQVGVFTSNSQTENVVGDYAFISPQYGDTMSHIHRTCELSAKPAGVQVVTWLLGGEGTVRIDGYGTNFERTASDGEGSEGEGTVVAPRLRLGGFWSGSDDVSYELWLSASSSESPEQSIMPSSDFSSVVLCWRSSDPDEGSGFEEVSRFYGEVGIGSHGLSVSLEPGSDDLGLVYSADEDDPSKRTWSIRMPEYARGWSPNATDGEVRLGASNLRVHGVQSSRAIELHVSVPSYVFPLVLQQNPEPGQTMVVTGEDDEETTFRFIGWDTDTSAFGDDEVLVPISGSPFDTLSNAACVYSERGAFSILSDSDSGTVYAGAKSVTLAGSSVGPIDVGLGTIVMVGDQGARCMAYNGYASFPSANYAVTLENGLSAYFDGTVSCSPGDNGVIDVETGCRGAAFRYNIGMDQALNASFPPVPARSGSLMLNGVEQLSDAYPSSGNPSFGIGPDTLYWYSDAFGSVPWSSAYGDPEEDDSASRFWLLFHFITMFSGQTGPVTSLRPSEGSPVKVYRCGTRVPATVGDLEIDVELTTDVFDAGAQGYKAVKTSRNGKLLLGPVVERLVAGPGIQIDSVAGQPNGQGTVTVSATNAMYSGEMETIALENAKEEMIGMFPYIRLLGWDASSQANVNTGFVARFHVPTGIADGVYRVRLYASVFGEDSFSGEDDKLCAGLRMTYNILPNWSPYGPSGASMNVRSDIIAPDDERVVNIPFGVSSGGKYSYTAFDPMMFHNDTSIQDVDGRCTGSLGAAFPNVNECQGYVGTHSVVSGEFGVRPGYVVAVRFSRCAPPNESHPYTGRIGFTSLRWSLVRLEDDGDTKELDTVPACEDVIRRLQKVASTISASSLDTTYTLRRALLSIVEQLR